jgi:putative salt-induced outer membrane protein YdiY
MNMNAKLIALCAITALASTAKAEPSKTNEWEHTLAIGATATSGNTDTKLYSASWLSEFRRLNGDLIRLSADAQNGENKGVKNADNAKGDQNYKHLISDRAYIVGDVAEMYDSVADISYRITPSVGVGYFLMKGDAASLSVDLGPGYQWEKIGGIEDDYAVARASERYERKLTATAKCWQSLDYTPKVEDFDVYTISGEIGAEAAMTSTINLRAVFKDQYINVPAADRKRNDTQIIAALAFKI